VKKKKSSEPLDWTYYYGKSYILPLFLVSIAVFFAISFANKTSQYYYFTVAAYLGLGIFYYVKKPYLRIGKDFISTRKMGSDKSVEASQIKSIECGDGYILISLNNKRAKWVFAKSINRYPIEEMAAALETFAKVNHVNYIKDWKETV
jgi:hypothetical protein